MRVVCMKVDNSACGVR